MPPRRSPRGGHGARLARTSAYESAGRTRVFRRLLFALLINACTVVVFTALLLLVSWPLTLAVAAGAPDSAWFVPAWSLGLLAPLAAALTALTWQPAPARLRRVAGIAAALSSLAALTQWALTGGLPAPADWLLHAGGAAAAAWGTPWLIRRGLGARLVLAAATLPVFAGVLAVVLAGNRLAGELRLSGWDAGFPVGVAAEVDESRRYAGEVGQARICAGSPEEPVCVEPGAGLAARRRLVEAAEGSQRLELAAEVRSSHDAQAGPARIVTFSLGPYARNATLAQQGRTLVLRLRTPATGPNGVEPQLELPDAVPAGVPTRVRATFVAGTVTMRAESAGRRASGRFRRGALGSWLLVFPIDALEPGHMGRAAAASALVLFGIPGLALGRALGRYPLAAVAAAAALAVALLGGLEASLGGAPAPYALALAAGLAGLGAAWAARSGKSVFDIRC